MQRLKSLLPSLLLVLVVSSTLSACAQRETLNSVNDFCLVDARISISVGEPGQDDPGNQWDSDETVNEVLKHNEVHDKVCA